MKRRFKKMENKVENKVENEALENEVVENKVESQENAKISPPWVGYARAMNALFGHDPDIKFEFDDDENIIKLYVNGAIKADAISKIVPSEKDFGGVKVKVEVIPSDNADDDEAIFRNAFSSNPVFSFVQSVKSEMMPPVTYVVFKKLVAQYFNDDLSDIHGNRTVLIQDIAKEVLDRNNVFYCTDVE